MVVGLLSFMPWRHSEGTVSKGKPGDPTAQVVGGASPQTDFPEAVVVANGGISQRDQADDFLRDSDEGPAVDGVMLVGPLTTTPGCSETSMPVVCRWPKGISSSCST